MKPENTTKADSWGEEDELPPYVRIDDNRSGSYYVIHDGKVTEIPVEEVDHRQGN